MILGIQVISTPKIILPISTPIDLDVFKAAAMTSHPSSISPGQLNLLHVVCAMAWADGNLANDEATLMLEQFSKLFASDDAQQEYLRQELQHQMAQNTPLEALVANLKTNEDRELALKLSYMVIQSGGGSPHVPTISAPEKVAYRRLVDLLTLSNETVEQVEWAADEELKQQALPEDPLEALMARLSQLLHRK